MHYLQKKILDKLIYAAELPYSQLRPAGIESNHFAYHLKQLMKQRLIEKSAHGYSLSSNGLAYCDRLSMKTLEPRPQPKIITMLDISDGQGQTVLYERRTQPYIGMVGRITGKVHLGETISQAAGREATEKLGLENIRLDHRGMVYLAISSSGQLISQVLAHVFSGHCPAATPLKSDTAGQSYWDNPRNIPPQRLIPGYFEISKLLESNQLFFKEFSFNL